jgi:transcriptional regulator
VSDDLDLVRGTLDLFILKTLTWGPMHGLAIVRWIERVTERRLQVEEGALYPALHRMERKGWLDGEWGVTDGNRRAKYYTLTAAGRKHFTARLTLWERYTQAAAMVFAAREASA